MASFQNLDFWFSDENHKGSHPFVCASREISEFAYRNFLLDGKNIPSGFHIRF